jgi:hypothetical protein
MRSFQTKGFNTVFSNFYFFLPMVLAKPATFADKGKSDTILKLVHCRRFPMGCLSKFQAFPEHIQNAKSRMAIQLCYVRLSRATNLL